ncbi:MAG: ethylbenzene dehydrogenase-related protein [bacterium]|nr:ethylbenzene dehydrogenase-related protein [bacterium]MDT8367091.1 ethylbenzene dehydrogenase-related protein [bacterium]
MNIALNTMMKTVLLTIPALLLAAVLYCNCSSPFNGDTLVAQPVDGEPGPEEWEKAVPLDLVVWMGNVNIPEEIVALDMETSHRSTPECHHGPSTSDPVKVRIQAVYNREELFVLMKWPDRTQDRELGTWELGPEGWIARPGADDGIAILWELSGEPAGGSMGRSGGSGSGEGPFRCQYACHMMEVDVYDGGTKMRMGMKSSEGQVLDLWRWRASVTGSFGLADDMVIDETGKRGDEGQVLPVVNRSTKVPGPGTVNGSVAPYYIVETPIGRQGDVRAKARWEKGMWTLLLKRALDTADPDDVVYSPGGRVPFSVSLFDNTFSEHHVSADSAFLVLWRATRIQNKGRDFDEPMDF